MTLGKRLYGLVIGWTIAALMLAPASVLAQVQVNQGKPGSYGAWPVSLSATVTVTGTVNQGTPAVATNAWYVNTTAETTGVTTEVLVLASATTAVPTSALAGRRAIELQNIGSNSIFCCVGASCTAVVNKTRKIAVGDAWSIDAGAAVVVRCIAATADQTTGVATIVTEVK
jgi:hypothetical protein